MAYKNKFISNPVIGQDILFLQTAKDTDGFLLEMESTYNALSQEPPQHYHPYQEEDFTVLSGEISVRIDGKVKVLKAGETLHIEKNKPHSMWNNTNSKTTVNWKVCPAMSTEYLLETGMGLANDGKISKKGMPGILQVALLASRFSSVYRLVKPPLIIQKIVFTLLMPFAYLFGYRATYDKYLD
jgi:quercetin dioxygenase-like cupin family protein